MLNLRISFTHFVSFPSVLFVLNNVLVYFNNFFIATTRFQTGLISAGLYEINSVNLFIKFNYIIY